MSAQVTLIFADGDEHIAKARRVADMELRLELADGNPGFYRQLIAGDERALLSHGDAAHSLGMRKYLDSVFRVARVNNKRPVYRDDRKNDA